MIKAVFILGLATIASAQVLRISPVVIGSGQAGQEQVIQLGRGGGVVGSPVARNAPYQSAPSRPTYSAPQPTYSAPRPTYSVASAYNQQPSAVVQIQPAASFAAVQPVAVFAAQPAQPLVVSSGSFGSFNQQQGSYRAPVPASYGSASAHYEKEENVKIEPYAFGFESEDEYKTKIGRQESADEQGVVTGSYSLSDANGIARVVNYIADSNGFRATVKTNELGTLTSEPADVKIESTATNARR